MKPRALDLDVDGTAIRLAYLQRAGSLPPLVCLHGFGSSKEDYADLALRSDFDDRPLILWDAPGCGASDIEDPTGLSIPFLVKVAIAACDALGIERFHLSGHSMGGLTALLLAHTYPDRVLSFINIEGNVAPEDCFLSRQIIEHPAETPAAFLNGFADRVRARNEFSSALYAASLPLKVRATTSEPILSSMVALSDTAPLMRDLAALPIPRCFIYGDQNRHLSYLGHLPKIGVEVIEIPQSGHFPMYANPPALWAAMAEFLRRHEAGS